LLGAVLARARLRLRASLRAAACAARWGVVGERCIAEFFAPVGWGRGGSGRQRSLHEPWRRPPQKRKAAPLRYRSARGPSASALRGGRDPRRGRAVPPRAAPRGSGLRISLSLNLSHERLQDHKWWLSCGARRAPSANRGRVAHRIQAAWKRKRTSHRMHARARAGTLESQARPRRALCPNKVLSPP